MELKKELRHLFRSMDFLSQRFQNKIRMPQKDRDLYFRMYQQLGLAWEFLALQCRHSEGYQKTRDNKEVCKICGKVKDVEEFYYLLSRKGLKIIGRKVKPNSIKVFKNEKESKILEDTIQFHGVQLKVDVQNAHRSRLFSKEHEINVAADRMVQLKERGIEVWIDTHLVKIEFKKQSRGKKNYGAFPWEMRKKNLEKFPVLFEFDEKYRFLGLTILK